MSLSPPYLALSYRWGLNPKLLLLKSTLADFRKGKPINQLPKTFFELVQIARHFSVKYVWIDALCIIQDSKEDWDAEASTMRMVYANSKCTIAASSSLDANGRLFRSRENGIARAPYVTLSLIANGQQQRQQQLYIIEKDYWCKSLRAGPLYKRGWVFQERYLSHHLLHFTDNQIIFECLTGAKCEAFPNGLLYYTPDKDLDALWQYSITKRLATSIDCPIPKSVYLLWRNLIKEYSAYSFIYVTDKLPAFSGIAKLFQEVTGDEYIAGLWKSNILEGLDWCVYDLRPELCQIYHAPSWSWTSVEGPFKPSFLGLSSRQFVTLVHMEVSPCGMDPTGAVIGGHITLEGVLTRARKLYTRDTGESLLIVGSNYMSVRIYLDKISIAIQDGQLFDCLTLNIETSSGGGIQNNPEYLS